MAASKQFSPTARKIRQARLKGDVAKSSAFTAASGSALAFLSIIIFVKEYQHLTDFTVKSLSHGADFHTNHMLLSLSAAAYCALEIVLLPLALAAITGLTTELMQVGLYFLPGRIFQLGKLGLAQGLKRILGIRHTAGGKAPVGIPIEIFKLLTYLLALFAAGLSVFFYAGREVLYFEFQTFEQINSLFYFLITRLLAAMIGAYLLVGVFELFLAQRQRRLRLRMDRQELKKEQRETEGDPELIGLRKQMRQEMSSHQMIEEVRRAKVVITN